MFARLWRAVRRAPSLFALALAVGVLAAFPVPAHASTAILPNATPLAFPNIFHWLTAPLVSLVFAAAKPAIVGAIAVPVFNGVKAAWTALGRLPAWLQRIIVALLSAAGTIAVPVLGVPLPSDVSGVTIQWASGAVAGLLAFLFHLADKQAAAAPAPAPTSPGK